MSDRQKAIIKMKPKTVGFEMGQALEGKKILDMTCGSRTIWFNKNHPLAIYCDKRREAFTGIFGKSRTSPRQCVVDPDILCDFTALEKLGYARRSHGVVATGRAGA